MCKFQICKHFAKFLHWRNFFFTKFFAKNVKKFLRKKKRSKGRQSLILQPLLENNTNKKWVPHVQIPNQFAKIVWKKNCAEKIVKKNCAKKIVQKKLCEKNCVKNCAKICVKILQNILHFRPREEAARETFFWKNIGVIFNRFELWSLVLLKLTLFWQSNLGKYMESCSDDDYYIIMLSWVSIFFWTEIIVSKRNGGIK